MEVTIPEGSSTTIGEERSKTPSRLRRPSSHTSFKSSSIGLEGGGGGRDSSGSSSLDSRFSGFSSSGQQDSSNSNNNGGGCNGNTPSSTSSTLSIPMPSTPKDIFNPAAPPMMSSTRGIMSVLNKEKSLPPLPAGGLKKKSSGNLQRSIISNSKSSTTSIAGNNSLKGTGKYAFPSSSSSRMRTFSCTSSTSTSTPSTSPIPASAVLSPSSSAVTIKPNVRPLQLPRQSTTTSTTTARVVGGDRPPVPVPSPILHSPPQPPATNTITTTTMNNSLRAPAASLSTLSPRHRPSPITPILLGHAGTSSAPASPAINGVGAATTTTGMIRPKPRTGTGMVYRTSSYGVGGSKMRAPMILSGGSLKVSSTSSSGGGGGGSATAVGGSNSFSGAIAL